MDLAFTGAVELAERLRRRELSAVELLDAMLERVERLNGRINAIVVERATAAREEAAILDRELAAGSLRGPLHGVPLTVKESYDLAGTASTFGRPERRAHRAEQDAAAIARLKGAGAVIFGKTNVPKDLADWQSFNAVYGVTVNPWNPDLSPGGSSGGAAAALAAGLTPLELGSDIGGSIRVPAHFCGVCGHGPSFGLVPLRGHAINPGSPPNDLAVGGPMARGIADLTLAFEVLHGPDAPASAVWRLDLPHEPRHRLHRFRIAVLTDAAAFPVDGPVRGALARLAEGLRREGAAVTLEPELPRPAVELYRLYIALLRGATSARLTDSEAEALAARARAVPADARGYEPLMLAGLTQSHRAWLGHHAERFRLTQAWAAWFAGFDALVCPVATTTAFPHMQGVPKVAQQVEVNGSPRPAADSYFWLGLATTAGLPVTTVPIGRDARGLPIGAQVIGPAYHDRRTLRLAGLIEQAFGGFVPPPGWA